VAVRNGFLLDLQVHPKLYPDGMTTGMRFESAQHRRASSARLLLVAALVIGAVLFVIGTRGEHQETAAITAAPTTSTIATPTSTTAAQTTLLTGAATTVTTARPAEGTPAREAAERAARQPTTSAPAVAAVATPPASSTTAAEGTPAREATEGGSTNAGGHAETAAERSSEKVLGVNLESDGVVAAVVVVSIVLAGLVLARHLRTVLWIAGGFCGLAAAADVAELVRQVDRSKNGLAVIAGTVAAIHVVGAVAGMVAVRDAA
jgi:hypothetical protein